MPPRPITPEGSNIAPTRAEILEFVAQADARGPRFPRFFDGAWVTVERTSKAPDQDLNVGAALLPHSQVERALGRPDWEVAHSRGMPGFVTAHDGTTAKTTYYRFGDDDGVEPLVFWRSFYGMRPPYHELAEEFRFFHQLYFEPKQDEYIRFAENGDEEIIVRCSEDHVSIRRRELMEFVTAKDMVLALYVDRLRYGCITPDLTEEEELREDLGGDNWTYNFHRSDGKHIWRDERNVFSRLLGKMLLYPGPEWAYTPERDAEQYPEFIIGVDEHGKDVCYSCDHEGLSNFFGANRSAPNYLTPVFFRREVLQKYYADPSRYRVKDSYVSCGALWGLRLDNNHPKYVIVFLGDLGRDLPEKERPYWRSFNVHPDGGLSSTYFRRSMLGEYAEAVAEDHRFRVAYQHVQKAWRDAHGWPLFRDLADGDRHILSGLRIPLTDTAQEFDSQVLSLTKLLVDYLNEAQIGAAVLQLPADVKGISKLECFLAQEQSSATTLIVQYLRKLQELRSRGAAHAKGRKYEAAKAVLGISDMAHPQAFRHLLQQSIEILKALSASGEPEP